MPKTKQPEPVLPSLQELVDAGAHFGHRRSRSHPKSRAFVYTIRDRVLVINLEATQAKLEVAAKAAEALAASGCQFLFVGTKPQAKDAIEATATKASMPYVTHRWLGGTLTNYETIHANLEKLERLDEVVAGHEFEQFSKKERGRITKERDKLQKIFGGIRTMTTLPGALVVIDMVKESIVVAEANRLGLPIFAIVDTNADPSKISYPIPANDDSRRTIELVLTVLSEAISRGAAKAPKSVVSDQPSEISPTSTATDAIMNPNLDASGSTAERIAQAMGTEVDSGLSTVDSRETKSRPESQESSTPVKKRKTIKKVSLKSPEKKTTSKKSKVDSQ